MVASVIDLCVLVPQPCSWLPGCPSINRGGAVKGRESKRVVGVVWAWEVRSVDHGSRIQFWKALWYGCPSSIANVSAACMRCH